MSRMNGLNNNNNGSMEGSPMVSHSLPNSSFMFKNGGSNSMPVSTLSSPMATRSFATQSIMAKSPRGERKKSVRWDPKIPDQDPNRKKLKEKDYKVQKATGSELEEGSASPPPPDAEEEWRQGSMFVRQEKKKDYEPDFALFEEQKKLKGFLFFSKNKDAERRLSTRALNLKPNTEISEDKFDELLAKIVHPVQGLKIGKRKAMFSGAAENCFTGEELAKFIAREMGVDLAKATYIGQTLFMNHEAIVCISKKHTSFHCKADTFYRLKMHELKQADPINKIKIYNGFVKDEPVELSEKLIKMGMKVMDEFKKGDGIIDFKSAKASTSGVKFLYALAALQKADLIQSREDEKRIPLLLNVFHCFIIANFLLFGVPLHTSQRREVITRLIDLDGCGFSGELMLKFLFNERVAGTINSRYVKLLSISEKDPLRMLSVYDGADYCVPIMAYNTGNFQQLLKANAKRFVENSVQVSTEKNEIILPRLFKDHLDDFGGESTEVVKFIGQMTDKFGAVAKMASTATIRFGDATYEGCYRCKIPYVLSDSNSSGKAEIK